jgi:hypothetical protein
MMGRMYCSSTGSTPTRLCTRGVGQMPNGKHWPSTTALVGTLSKIRYDKMEAFIIIVHEISCEITSGEVDEMASTHGYTHGTNN